MTDRSRVMEDLNYFGRSGTNEIEFNQKADIHSQQRMCLLSFVFKSKLIKSICTKKVTSCIRSLKISTFQLKNFYELRIC